MKDKFATLCDELKAAIQSAYEEGVSMDDAEKLAAKFLFGQMEVAQLLAHTDLDARMKKTGVKAIKAAIYMEEATKGEKKPSDTYLSNIVDQNQLVIDEQNRFDEAEIRKDELENLFSIFREGHIYFRGIAKGRFE